MFLIPSCDDALSGINFLFYYRLFMLRYHVNTKHFTNRLTHIVSTQYIWKRHMKTALQCDFLLALTGSWVLANERCATRIYVSRHDSAMFSRPMSKVLCGSVAATMTLSPMRFLLKDNRNAVYSSWVIKLQLIIFPDWSTSYGREWYRGLENWNKPQ